MKRKLSALFIGSYASIVSYGAYTYRPLLDTNPDLLSTWPDDEQSFAHKLARFTSLKLIGAGLYIFGTQLNTVTISEEDEKALQDAMLSRPTQQGLITVCNHTSTLDDPMLISSLTGPNFPYQQHRWGICSRELGFAKGNVLHSFLGTGRALPVVRGAGEPYFFNLVTLITV